MRPKLLSLAMAASLLAFGVACNKKPADNTQAQQMTPDQSSATAPAADNTATAPAPDSTSGASSSAGTGSTARRSKPSASGSSSGAATATAPQPVTIPSGTILSVRTGSTISTKTSTSGDQFAAVLAEPLVVNGATIAEAGARATGSVVEAVPLGKFKGGAKLRLSLDSVTVNGKRVPLSTSSVNREGKSKGKRSATFIGGGAGLGALIGGIAGGGKGAALGALAGGGAGTAGAAYTGNQQIVIPAESVLSFKVLQDTDVPQ